MQQQCPEFDRRFHTSKDRQRRHDAADPVAISAGKADLMYSFAEQFPKK